MKKPSKHVCDHHIHLRISEALHAAMKTFMAEHDIANKSDLIRVAVEKYLEPADYNDATLALKGMRDTQAKLNEVRDMVDVSFRYLKGMHENLLAYHPDIQDEIAEPALKSASLRQKKFMDYFRTEIRREPAFFEYLLHTYYTDGGP
jgi:Arc/MetJ-type ribon-helix-helix transcriptional regulator